MTKDTETKRPQGRPRLGLEPKEQIAIRISADVKRYIDDQGNRSAFVEQVIKRTKAFKDWSADSTKGGTKPNND